MLKEFHIPIELIGKEKVDYNQTLKFFKVYVDLIEVSLQESMSKRQKEVIACLLYFDMLLSNKCQDDTMRWELIYSKGYRDKLQAMLNLSNANFYNILTAIKKFDIFVGNTIKSEYWIRGLDEEPYLMRLSIYKE